MTFRARKRLHLRTPNENNPVSTHTLQKIKNKTRIAHWLK